MNAVPDRPAAATRDRYPGYKRERPLTLHVPGNDRPVALVVLLHGGGFVSGSPDAVAPLAECLAERLASAVVTPAYTLADEAPFPAAAEDAYAALRWAESHARESGWRGARLVLAGIEAGGNLAAAAAMMARDRGGPPVAAQVLVRPMLDPSLSSRSMRCSTRDDAHRCRAAYRAYLASGADQLHPYGAPLASMRLAGLPPALVLTAETDPLRDEAETYAANLIRAGVATQVIRLGDARDAAVCEASTLDLIAAFLGPRLAAPRHAAHEHKRTQP